jgi:anti-anti-sigma regulatory factor
MAKQAVDLGGSMKAQIEPAASGTSVVLAGNITEATSFKPLLGLRGPLVIDLAGVARINSIGVRGWLTFVTQCDAAGTDVVLDRCSPAIVSQISMISNFVGQRTRVRSLFAPYVCTACGADHLQLLEVTPGVPLSVPPAIACPKCRQAMQLDEPEAMYPSLFRR